VAVARKLTINIGGDVFEGKGDGEHCSSGQQPSW
jgi:hypothetical protein